MYDVMHDIVLYMTQSECGIDCNCVSGVLMFAPASRLKKCEVLCVSNSHTSVIQSSSVAP